MKQLDTGDAKSAGNDLISGGYTIMSRINGWEVQPEYSGQMKSEGSVRVVIQRLTGLKRLPVNRCGGSDDTP